VTQTYVIRAVKTYTPGGEPFTLALPPSGYALLHVTKAVLRQPSVALDQFIFHIYYCVPYVTVCCMVRNVLSGNY